METFVLQAGIRTQVLGRLTSFLNALSPSKAWKVEVSEYRPKRSDEQNRYLWGVCYGTVLRHLPGWEAEDVHDYFLGEHFGWETLEGFGRKRVKPIRRSSKLSTTEFADYVAFIQRTMAEKGVYIPDPGENDEPA